MGRPVKLRTSYLQDAGYALRISSAVELDETRPASWRRELNEHLRAAATLMTNAPPPEPKRRQVRAA